MDFIEKADLLEWCDRKNMLNMARHYLDDLRAIGKGKYKPEAKTHPAQILRRYGLVSLRVTASGVRGRTSQWFLTPLGRATLDSLCRDST